MPAESSAAFAPSRNDLDIIGRLTCSPPEFAHDGAMSNPRDLVIEREIFGQRELVQ
jgi:hypothetical protein